MTKICIDAGHGGKDVGAVNGKYYEKNAALGIALKLGDKLKEKGIKVIYTRKDDIYPSLPQRCKIANDNKADYFVSIHCNSAENKNASGIETWKFPNAGGITKKLADNVQNALTSAFPEENDRGVKESGLYVLTHTKMPAILVEVGFISNDRVAPLLFSYSYQMKLADRICEGILNTINHSG